MAFLAGALFPEILVSAEEGLGAILTGFSTEFVKQNKQAVANVVGGEIGKIASSNPNGMTNLTLNEAIKTKNHAIAHPRKSGRKRKNI
jgi:hypothetical protein